MLIATNPVQSAACQDGQMRIVFESGVEIRFPIQGNPRLSKGTAQQLNTFDISPFGIHWPELDEDLSFKGLLSGNYGQQKSTRLSRTRRRKTEPAQ